MPRIQMYVEFMDGPCEGELAFAVEIDQNGATLWWGPDGDGPYLYHLKPDTNRFYYKGGDDANGS